MKEKFFLESELTEMEALEIKGGADYELNGQTKCSNTAKGCGAGADQTECVNSVAGCGSTIVEPPIFHSECTGN